MSNNENDVKIVWRLAEETTSIDYSPPNGWYVDKVNGVFSPGGRRWACITLRPEPKLVWKADS